MHLIRVRNPWGDKNEWTGIYLLLSTVFKEIFVSDDCVVCVFIYNHTTFIKQGQ